MKFIIIFAMCCQVLYGNENKICQRDTYDQFFRASRDILKSNIFRITFDNKATISDNLKNFVALIEEIKSCTSNIPEKPRNDEECDKFAALLRIKDLEEYDCVDDDIDRLYKIFKKLTSDTITETNFNDNDGLMKNYVQFIENMLKAATQLIATCEIQNQLSSWSFAALSEDCRIVTEYINLEELKQIIASLRTQSSAITGQ